MTFLSKEPIEKDSFIFKYLPFSLSVLSFSDILTGTENNERNLAEINLAWPKTWTYQSICVVFARRVNYVRKRTSSYSDVWHDSWQKPPNPQKNPKSKVTTQKGHQNLDYTTIVDRLRTVSWSHGSHLIGVLKPVYAHPTFPLTAKAV